MKARLWRKTTSRFAVPPIVKVSRSSGAVKGELVSIVRPAADLRDGHAYWTWQPMRDVDITMLSSQT
jgi:hypothetical protein